MIRRSDQTYLLNDQYKDASNLNARLRLHERFSTNKYGWHRWAFDQFKIAPGSHILELGCGPGELWTNNLDRIPDTWDITLSDFSPGMLQEARQALAAIQHQFQFQVIDAQAIPIDDASLDVVIANHMLYHVPDRPRALSEMRRVLKPDGHLYAATVGESNLREIDDLIHQIDNSFVWDVAGDEFTLENGVVQLAQWFASVTLRRYEDALVVTEAQPLLDHILSGKAKPALASEKLQRLQALVEQEMSAHGAIHITKDAGLFEAQGTIS